MAEKTTKEAPSQAEAAEAKAEELLATSSDARFASYEPNTDLPDENPPLGSHVVQTRGKPSKSGEAVSYPGIAD